MSKQTFGKNLSKSLSEITCSYSSNPNGIRRMLSTLCPTCGNNLYEDPSFISIAHCKHCNKTWNQEELFKPKNMQVVSSGCVHDWYTKLIKQPCCICGKEMCEHKHPPKTKDSAYWEDSWVKTPADNPQIPDNSFISKIRCTHCGGELDASHYSVDSKITCKTCGEVWSDYVLANMQQKQNMEKNKMLEVGKKYLVDYSRIPEQEHTNIILNQNELVTVQEVQGPLYNLGFPEGVVWCKVLPSNGTGTTTTIRGEVLTGPIETNKYRVKLGIPHVDPTQEVYFTDKNAWDKHLQRQYFVSAIGARKAKECFVPIGEKILYVTGGPYLFENSVENPLVEVVPVTTHVLSFKFTENGEVFISPAPDTKYWKKNKTIDFDFKHPRLVILYVVEKDHSSILIGHDDKVPEKCAICHLSGRVFLDEYGKRLEKEKGVIFSSTSYTSWKVIGEIPKEMYKKNFKLI